MLIDKETRGTQAGLITFDTALPQPWLDSTANMMADIYDRDRDECYDRIRCNTVWCYDNTPIFGAPVALTPQLARELANLEAILREARGKPTRSDV